MARRTKEDAEKTRQKLMQTALMLFSEKGVSHTTLADIAKAANVTKGAFYWHFDNKRAVFEAIFEQYSQESDRFLSAFIKDEEVNVETFLKASRMFFDYLEDSEELMALYSIIFYKCEFIDDFSSMMTFIQNEEKEWMLDLQEYLDALPDSEWVSGRKGETTTLAEVLYDAMTGLTMRCVISNEKGFADKAVSTVSVILRGGGLKL